MIRKECGVTTCSICKAASHGNADCPKDEATAAVLAAAREEGWTRCYRCRAMVELTQGCYHMSMSCRILLFMFHRMEKMSLSSMG